MQVSYKKQKQNIVMYRIYKHFSNEVFKFDVKKSVIQMSSENNDLEVDPFKAALDKLFKDMASIKKVVCSSKPSAFHK